MLLSPLIKSQGWPLLMSLEGCGCPMGMVSRNFLKRLGLESDEVAVVDLEAGVEHFGRGLETSVDCVIVVVDPSIDSLQIAERIMPFNTSGGLAARGHPVGATGAAQVIELVWQLRGEAGQRQVKGRKGQGPKVGLAQNNGGRTEDGSAITSIIMLKR